MENLTPQEEELMLIIWQQGSGILKNFINAMVEPYPPYTTVASTIKNLERKSYVSGELFGNTYRYTPLISENEYKTKFMSGIVSNYFENSYAEMVSFFAKKQKISAEELQEIIKLIEEGDETSK
jgi:predicted transcriptional regulator